MNELTCYQSQQFGEVRTVLRNGEPWFVAADVCRSLDLNDTGRTISRLDDDERGRIQIDHPQNQKKRLEVYIVNEFGLYALVLGSRKPEAKAFKRWITHEVLPSIRKTGGYQSDAAQQKMAEQMAQMATQMQAMMQMLREQVSNAALFTAIQAQQITEVEREYIRSRSHKTLELHRCMARLQEEMQRAGYRKQHIQALEDLITSY